MTQEKIKQLLKQIQRQGKSFTLGVIAAILTLILALMCLIFIFKGQWCRILQCPTTTLVATPSARISLSSKPVAAELTEQQPTIINEQLKVTPDNTQTTTYTIQSGDSLWKIAQEQLGNGNRWLEIYQLNRNVIGHNPNLIYPNVSLELPPR